MNRPDRRQALARLGGVAGLGFMTALGVAPAWALLSRDPPPEVLAALPGAAARGNGRLTFLGLHVYDARLWAAAGFEAEAFDRVPLALELVYARKLSGAQIAERSLKEMQRVPGITADQASGWLAEMSAAFPDVAANDRITGLLLPSEGARFFLNGRPRRDVRDPEFARRFFGIWLAPQTSQPKLRESLLGQRG